MSLKTVAWRAAGGNRWPFSATWAISRIPPVCRAAFAGDTVRPHDGRDSVIATWARHRRRVGGGDDRDTTTRDERRCRGALPARQGRLASVEHATSTESTKSTESATTTAESTAAGARARARAE